MDNLVFLRKGSCCVAQVLVSALVWVPLITHAQISVQIPPINIPGGTLGKSPLQAQVDSAIERFVDALGMGRTVVYAGAIAAFLGIGGLCMFNRLNWMWMWRTIAGILIVVASDTLVTHTVGSWQ